MTTSWHSYPKIYNLGHAALKSLFNSDVLVEEKIDGSQFSFGKFDGVLKCRSKGQQLIVDAPEKMFEKAVATALKLLPNLHEGYTYRAEYLQKPKHNSLTYGRVPKDNLIIFDISPGEEVYLSYGEKKKESERLGLEVVPLIYEGLVSDAQRLLELMDRESSLGDVKIEGFVVKNYLQFGTDKKVLMGKHVSEAFKEIHTKEWANTNPSSSDVLFRLSDSLKTEARWEKAVQHLREKGQITDTPKDIGNLLKEIHEDIKAECEAEIKEQLYRWALPHVVRKSTQGFPEWYKQQLLSKHFEAN